MNFAFVMTTINAPTKLLHESLDLVTSVSRNIIVVGDEKTPNEWETLDFTYMNLDFQARHFEKIAKLTKVNHYARKNLGYLLAAKRNFEWIYESDDDNFHFASPDSIFANGFQYIESSDSEWINPYEIFSANRTQNWLWPRGFPLDKINYRFSFQSSDINRINSPLLQGLANGNPDVDAIFRLVFQDHDSFKFIPNQIFHLNPFQFTPINSQSTWWHKSIFRLLYLPSYSTFRVTDILRGYVANLALSNRGLGLDIFSPVVFQQRNDHNLISDFEQEIPLYLRSNDFFTELKQIRPAANFTYTNFLQQGYEIAAKHGLVELAELETLHAWNNACDDLGIPT